MNSSSNLFPLKYNLGQYNIPDEVYLFYKNSISQLGYSDNLINTIFFRHDYKEAISRLMRLHSLFARLKNPRFYSATNIFETTFICDPKQAERVVDVITNPLCFEAIEGFTAHVPLLLHYQVKPDHVLHMIDQLYGVDNIQSLINARPLLDEKFFTIDELMKLMNGSESGRDLIDELVMKGIGKFRKFQISGRDLSPMLTTADFIPNYYSLLRHLEDLVFLEYSIKDIVKIASKDKAYLEIENIIRKGISMPLYNIFGSNMPVLTPTPAPAPDQALFKRKALTEAEARMRILQENEYLLGNKQIRSPYAKSDNFILVRQDGTQAKIGPKKYCQQRKHQEQSVENQDKLRLESGTKIKKLLMRAFVNAKDPEQLIISHKAAMELFNIEAVYRSEAGILNILALPGDVFYTVITNKIWATDIPMLQQLDQLTLLAPPSATSRLSPATTANPTISATIDAPSTTLTKSTKRTSRLDRSKVSLMAPPKKSKNQPADDTSTLNNQNVVANDLVTNAEGNINTFTLSPSIFGNPESPTLFLVPDLDLVASLEQGEEQVLQNLEGLIGETPLPEMPDEELIRLAEEYLRTPSI